MHKDLENNKEGSKIVSLVIIKFRGKFQYVTVEYLVD